MKRLFILAIFGIVTIAPVHAMGKKRKISEPTNALFGNDPHKDKYWDALVKVSHGDKQAAIAILDSVKSKKRQCLAPAWKEKKPKNIDDFFDKMFVKNVEHSPELLSHLHLFESIGIDAHNAHFNEISLAGYKQDVKEAKNQLATLRTYDHTELTEQQKVSANIFEWQLKHEIRNEQFLLHEYKMNQLDGILFYLNILMVENHQLETKKDVQNYIARLNKIPQLFQQTIEFMELQRKHGIVPPRFTIEKVIKIINKSIPESITENVLYAHLLEKLEELGLEDGNTLREQAYQTMITAVYPAYQQLERYFRQLLEHAQTSDGVWALPNGDAYYAHMLRSQTTTNMSPREIHELGLQEVAKIQAEMKTILDAEHIDTTGKNIGTVLQELSQDPRFHYPNTDEGRQQCLADYRAILERSRKELAHLFNLKPRTDIIIKPVPEAEQEGAALAYYLAPSADGARSGVFFANLRNMSEVPQFGMETLLIHEAEPGHHFQFALQYEMDMPMLRKLGDFNAYCEGWALYSEKLAYERGFYSSPLSELGHLKDELLRAARLVIDTGIHHRRWTREQAIAYMEQITGHHHDDAVSEVERYFVLPGQACSYKIGQLTILRLRKEAQEQLKEKFDIREFHDEVLKLGLAPLAVLENVIHSYIARTLAA